MELPLNYYALALATTINIVLGIAWYGPLFGKVWMNLMGFTAESIQRMQMSPLRAMVSMAVLAVLMNYVLAYAVFFSAIVTQSEGALGGMMTALWLWLGFVVPLTAGSYLWEGKSVKVWVLNASYYLVTLLIGGAIFGAWVS